MESKSVKRVDILNILSFVWKKWFVVMLAGVLFAGIMGGSEFFQYKVQQKNELYANAHKTDPVYGSFVIYINNFDESDNYYNRIEDVTSIIRGYTALTSLMEKNKLQVDYSSMANCVTAVTVGINQLEISVEGSLIGMNQETVVGLTEDLCEIVFEIFEEKFGKDSIVLIDKPHAKAYVLEKSITLEEGKDKRITKKDVIKQGILGGIIGVVLGAVAVVFYVLISTVLRTKNEVLQCYGLPLLGSVDKDGKDKEEYKRIIKRMKEAEILSVVSATDYEYRKQTVEELAGNLAVNGKSAVVIQIVDGQVVEENDLYQYILGRKQVKDMIQNAEKDSVKKIVWSQAAPEDMDLFTNDALPKALSELKEQFDYVLVDCPAITTSAAGLNLSTVCDTVIVVASCGHVHEAEVDKLKYNFRENHIECLGVIYVE